MPQLHADVAAAEADSTRARPDFDMVEHDVARRLDPHGEVAPEPHMQPFHLHELAAGDQQWRTCPLRDRQPQRARIGRPVVVRDTRRGVRGV
jgi:hypothetical protein